MAKNILGNEVDESIPIVNTAIGTQQQIIDTTNTALGAIKDPTYSAKIEAGYDSGQNFDYGKTSYEVSDKVNGPAATVDVEKLAAAGYAPVEHIDPTTGVKTVSLQEIPKAELAAKAQAGNALAGIINKGDVNQVTTDANQLAQGRLGGMLSQNSPYLRDARNRAMRTANSRGLLNSAMAAGMGEEAAIGAAAPIAVQDAQTYGLNARQNAQELNKALDTNAQLYGTQAQLDTNVNVNQQNTEQSVNNNYATNQTEALFKNQEAGNQANITNAQLGTETVLRNADNTLKANMFNAGEVNTALKFNATNEQSLLELGITLETDANKATAGWNFQGMRDKFASMNDAEKAKYLTSAEMTKLYSSQNFEVIKGATLSMLEEIGADNVAGRKMIVDKYSNALAIRLQNVVDAAAMDREVAGNAAQITAATISAETSKYGTDKQAETSKYNTDAQTAAEDKKILASLIAGNVERTNKTLLAPDTPSSVKQDAINADEIGTIQALELITYMQQGGDITDLLLNSETIGTNGDNLYSGTEEDRVRLLGDKPTLKDWYNSPNRTQAEKDTAMADPELGAAITEALK